MYLVSKVYLSPNIRYLPRAKISMIVESNWRGETCLFITLTRVKLRAICQPYHSNNTVGIPLTLKRIYCGVSTHILLIFVRELFIAFKRPNFLITKTRPRYVIIIYVLLFYLFACVQYSIFWCALMDQSYSYNPTFHFEYLILDHVMLRCLLRGYVLRAPLRATRLHTPTLRSEHETKMLRRQYVKYSPTICM